MASIAALYTMVQHSAAAYRDDETFRNAVEMKEISLTDGKLVLKVGGLLYGSYSEAQAKEDAINYPPGVDGIVPKVRGTFSVKTLDGQKIYLPAEGEAK